jgi:hypothetical protein
LSTLDTEGY